MRSLRLTRVSNPVISLMLLKDKSKQLGMKE